MKIKKIYIIDSCLKDFHGHFFMEAIAIRSAAIKAGIEAEIWGNNNLDRKIATKFNINPLLPLDFFSAPELLRLIWEKYDRTGIEIVAEQKTENKNGRDTSCLLRILRFFINLLQNTPFKWLFRWPWAKRTMKQVIDTLPIQDDSIYYFQPTSYDVIRRILKELNIRRLALNIVFSSHYAMTMGEIADILKLLRQRPVGAQTFFFWSSEIHLEMHRKFGLDTARLAPITLADNITNCYATKYFDGEIRLTFLGHSSYRKGFHLLPELVKRLKENYQGKNVVFDIQYIQPNSKDEKPHVIENAAKQLRQLGINLITRQLDDEQYRKFFDASDIVLLPYQINGCDSHYSTGGSSGILIEALARGKVVIVPENSWLSLQVNKFHSGKCFVSNEDFYKKVFEAIDHFDVLRELAQQNSEYWKKTHCPENFISTILKCFSSDSA